MVDSLTFFSLQMILDCHEILFPCQWQAQKRPYIPLQSIKYQGQSSRHHWWLEPREALPTDSCENIFQCAWPTLSEAIRNLREQGLRDGRYTLREPLLFWSSQANRVWLPLLSRAWLRKPHEVPSRSQELHHLYYAWSTYENSQQLMAFPASLVTMCWASRVSLQSVSTWWQRLDHILVRFLGSSSPPGLGLRLLSPVLGEKNPTKPVNRRRQWHPTPVLLSGKAHVRRSLVGCSPWGH